MVSTRHHPRPFPEPATPTSNRSNGSVSPIRASPPPRGSIVVANSSSPQKTHAKATSITKSGSVVGGKFVHTVPPLLIIWLTVSLPLVLWDTGYVFLRPHSMPGGRFHFPVWHLYALYGTVDYVYGWPAWEGHDGFTAAQSSLNVAETLMYIYYLVVIFQTSAKNLYTFGDAKTLFFGNAEKTIAAPGVARAVLVLFSAAIMTISKTVLYWLNEYFSGFRHIGHNSAWDLFWLWILPNGLWIIFPSYMAYVLGHEIVGALDGSTHDKQE